MYLYLKSILVEYLFEFLQYILFLCYSLTKREKQEREHKKTILQLAKEHEKARELENVQRYHMPQDLGKGEKG